jgi:hypothetical protein
MLIECADFNGAEGAFEEIYARQWAELEAILTRMPLHLKASDQSGKQGSPIFDPIGCNAYIKDSLEGIGWTSNPPIPQHLSFLGTDVDFVQEGVLIEVQFSNYPFLLNNVLRSELFHRTGDQLGGTEIKALIVVAKGKMFNRHASNSTLYYEQGRDQLQGLSQFDLIDIPVRMVGLMSPIEAPFLARWTEYHAKRYSRTVVDSSDVYVRFNSAQRRGGLPFLTVDE